MSLKPSRCLLTLLAIFFIAAFGEGCLESYRVRHGTWLLIASLCSFVMALSLSVYMSWFLNRLQKVGFLILATLFVSTKAASGCAVCFGNPNSSITKGASLGIAFLLGVITLVLGGFGALFLRWSRQAKIIRNA